MVGVKSDEELKRIAESIDKLEELEFENFLDDYDYGEKFGHLVVDYIRLVGHYVDREVMHELPERDFASELASKIWDRIEQETEPGELPQVFREYIEQEISDFLVEKVVDPDTIEDGAEGAHGGQQVTNDVPPETHGPGGTA